MRDFLLTAILAALIWIIASGGSCAVMKEVSSDLPGWIQAIGTVAAVGLAARALGEWRHQERAKRKADVADRLLEKFALVVVRIRNARNRTSINPAPERIDEYCRTALRESTPEQMTAIKESVEDCRIYLQTRRHYFDADLSSTFVKLRSYAHDVTSAYEDIDYAVSNEMSKPQGERERKVLFSSLAALGYIGEEREPNVLRLFPQHDELENKLSAVQTEFVEKLSPSLRMQG